jgi:DNA invertase Pin-like site-specific DNA recombinase
VHHLDRFARDVAALLDSLRAFSRRGVELHVVGSGRIEVDSASGFLITGVEGLMAEHYRRLIGEKSRNALARLRAMGRRVSRWAPYGFTFGAGGRLVEAPGEQATLRRIADLSGDGLSLRGLARALSSEGFLARNGRPFAAMTLSRLVTNRTVSDSHEAS